MSDLNWRVLVPGGIDIGADTEFGEYTISFDAPTAGGAKNLWLAGAGVDDFTVFAKLKDALEAARADYDARKAEGND